MQLIIALLLFTTLIYCNGRLLTPPTRFSTNPSSSKPYKFKGSLRCLAILCRTERSVMTLMQLLKIRLLVFSDHSFDNHTFLRMIRI